MRRNKGSYLGFVYLVIAVIAALGLLFGILAGYTDPRQVKWFAFFGLAYPFFLLLNVIMIFIWISRKKLIYPVLTVLLILSGWHTLIATVGFTGNTGDGPKKEGLVRMMTYNVHSFKPYGESNNELIKEKMLNVVREQDPDILCFQEYYTRNKGTFAITDSLKQMLKTHSYYFVPTSSNDYEATGLAIFSKFPIKDKGSILFSTNHNGNASIYVDLKINEKLFRVYNVHLQSIAFDKQDYTYLDQVKTKMDPEITPAKRIAYMLKTAFLKRSAQVDIMKAHMSTCKTPYLIAGDFNDTPASYAVTQMTKSLKNTFIEQGTGLGRTYNGKFPNFQIDYIAVTPAVSVMNYHIINAKLSDHFPVRSDLKID